MKGLQLVLPLLCIMAIGYGARRKDVLTPEVCAKLNLLLFWVINPAILFRSTYLMGAGAEVSSSFIVVMYATFLAVPPLAWLLGAFLRLPRERLGVSVLVSIRSNNVFMGIPVISMALGDAGMEIYSLFLAFGMAGFMVISIAWGECAFSGKLSLRSLRDTFFKVLKNPLVLSCLGGMGLGSLFSGVLPWGLETSMRILGNSASGMALLALGATLRPEMLFQGLRHSWQDACMKLVIHPGAVWLLCRFFPLPPVAEYTLVLLAALPAAINNFPLAQGMGMDGEYAAEVIATTTILSVGTVPIWIGILGM